MKNRIKEHRKVKASELIPNELNPRVHSHAQKQALKELYQEIGFARSVLAYELADGSLKLIDGHLRQLTLDPNEMIDVEILDVTDEEAAKLILAIDPLAQLAGYDAVALAALRDLVEDDSQALQTIWATIDRADQDLGELVSTDPDSDKQYPSQDIEETWSILIQCEDEEEQARLLRQFQEEGLRCKALMT